MTPLPAALGERGGTLTAWRLERSQHLPTWRLAEGAFLVGGRWSSAGRRVLDASLDPATTILEVAVHKGFNALDTLPHALLRLAVEPGAELRVLQAAEVPNPNWLRPGTVSANQQQFGDQWLAQHPLLVVSSAVSAHSWSLLIDVNAAADRFKLVAQERFALGPRLAQPTTRLAAPDPQRQGRDKKSALQAFLDTGVNGRCQRLEVTPGVSNGLGMAPNGTFS